MVLELKRWTTIIVRLAFHYTLHILRIFVQFIFMKVKSDGQQFYNYHQNNNFSPQIIKHTEDRDIWHWKSRGQARIYGGTKPADGITTLLSVVSDCCLTPRARFAVKFDLVFFFSLF